MRSSISREFEGVLESLEIDYLEATPGFEPGMGALQAPALPLGYIAVSELGARDRT